MEKLQIDTYDQKRPTPGRGTVEKHEKPMRKIAKQKKSNGNDITRKEAEEDEGQRKQQGGVIKNVNLLLK